MQIHHVRGWWLRIRVRCTRVGSHTCRAGHAGRAHSEWWSHLRRLAHIESWMWVSVHSIIHTGWPICGHACRTYAGCQVWDPAWRSARIVLFAQGVLWVVCTGRLCVVMRQGQSTCFREANWMHMKKEKRITHLYCVILDQVHTIYTKLDMDENDSPTSSPSWQFAGTRRLGGQMWCRLDICLEDMAINCDQDAEQCFGEALDQRSEQVSTFNWQNKSNSCPARSGSFTSHTVALDPTENLRSSHSFITPKMRVCICNMNTDPHTVILSQYL